MQLRSLNGFLIVRIAIVVAVLLAVCFGIYAFQAEHIRAEIERDELRQAREDISQRIADKYNVGVTNAISMAASPSLQDSLARGDRTLASEELAKIGNVFETQSNFKNIRVQLFGKDGTTFLRSWKPESHDDASEPAQSLLKESASKGQALAAWVADKDGVLIRASAPVRHNGQALGDIQFIQGVGSISRDYERSGKSYVLVVNDAALKLSPQLAKNKALGGMPLASERWFSDKVVAALSGLDPARLAESGHMLRHAGLFVMGMPLADNSGKIIGEHILAEPESVVDEKIALATRTGKQLIATMAGGFILLALFTVMGIRSIVLRPLAGIVAYSGEVAGGNWDAMPQGAFRYELFSLKGALLEMVEKLKTLQDAAEGKEREALQKAEEAERALARAQAEEARTCSLTNSMRDAAEKGTRISQEVLAAVESLAAEVDMVNQGVMRQKVRMTETATAMEQMNSTVIEVARNASDAASNAVSSSEMAQTGAKSVSKAVHSIEEIQKRVLSLQDTMGGLGERTDSIGKILGVISDIADQTNLLALNAAIEAARAGDAGRGFAVVADEVRKLAEKTMSATKEVEDAIKGIQTVARENIASVEHAAKEIVSSTQSANEAGQHMEGILSIVKDTAGKVESIAAASEEQSATSEQINRAVSEVNLVAGETAEGMERSAQALGRMTGLVNELDAIIGSMLAAEESEAVHDAGEVLIRWTKELSVGVAEIDGQHHVLVDLINELHRALKMRESGKVMASVVAKLKEYVVKHFATEERLFDRYGYPAAAEHKEIHRKFVAKVADFERSLLDGRATVSMEVMRFLKDWLVKHIMGTDKKYGPFLSSKGVS